MMMDVYYATVTAILTALVGLCVGSFLNVVIYRVPNNMSIAFPPSHCTTCNYQLKWYDNIPVVSYLVLGGKCRSCGEHISFRYTVVELLNTILWLLSLSAFYDNLIYAAIVAVASSVCLCIFCIDLEHMLIFDRFQVMLLILGVAAVFFAPDTVWYSHIIGGAAGFGLFYLIAVLAAKHYGKDALGGGDIKLAGVCGLFLGWEKLILMILIGSVSASILLLILRKKNGDEQGKEYPFGPFLVIGFLISAFFGQAILHGYLSLFI